MVWGRWPGDFGEEVVAECGTAWRIQSRPVGRPGRTVVGHLSSRGSTRHCGGGPGRVAVDWAIWAFEIRQRLERCRSSCRKCVLLDDDDNVLNLARGQAGRSVSRHARFG